MIEQRMEGVSEDHALRAALGSLLDISVERLPSFEGMARDMEWTAWLAGTLNLMPWAFAPEMATPPGCWLCRINSPYPGYDVHTLVCRGVAIAYDPHPEPQDIVLGPDVVRMGMLLFPLDPAEPSGRFALGD